MNDKFSLRDFFIYIIPGFIWILSFYILLLILGESIFLSNKNDQIYWENYVFDKNIFYIFNFVAAYLIGLILSFVSQSFMKYVNMKTKKISLFNAKEDLNNFEKSKLYTIKNDLFNTYIFENENQEIEFIDDILKLNNVENSWKRYRDLYLIIDYTMLPLIFFSILSDIALILNSNILVFFVFLITEIIYFLIAIKKSHYLRNKRKIEIYKILIAWYQNKKYELLLI